MIRRLILVVSLVFLAGCGSSTTPVPGQISEPTITVTSPAAEEPASIPVQLDIPKINAHSSLIKLGVTATGEHEVPDVKQPQQAGWFEPGPEPGQVGPAIILGHIDGNKQKGIFYRLHELAKGDQVDVHLDNGVGLRFEVYEVQRVDKGRFPKDKVYGFTDKRELRLITCGGEFDPVAHSYLDNTIVYAVLVM